ncbi:MAG: hypothetical protein JO031_04105 [Ktedonobacteraceae bacterium]|nr:hypothetical protein [Ktedonobacteraceae bacterium]
MRLRRTTAHEPTLGSEDTVGDHLLAASLHATDFTMVADGKWPDATFHRPPS